MENSKIFNEYYYTKKHHPRKMIYCNICKKKTLYLVKIGDLHVYECKCGNMTRVIL
jgi:hypothetical protein